MAASRPPASRHRTAAATVRELKAGRSASRAGQLQRFFKTGPGEYGEGDRFLGLTVPAVRRVATRARELPLDEVERLLESPWHEARLAALLVLVYQYERSDVARRRAVFRLYLRRTDRINNWDLVDLSAGRIVGAHLEGRSHALLGKLARSRSVWERRIAVIATQAFIDQGRFADTLALARLLTSDPHSLIHKAVGWMLREVGKRDERVLRRFLDRHAPALPRTTLRYAIERLPRATRRRYLAGRTR